MRMYWTIENAKRAFIVDAERKLFAVREYNPDAEYVVDADGRPIDSAEAEILLKRAKENFEREEAEKNKRELEERGGLESFSDVEVEYEIDGDGFGLFGFKNERGEVVIEPQYAWAEDFSLGLCAVNLNRTWYTGKNGERYYENHFGYIDRNGKTVIPFRFKDAKSFNKYGAAYVLDDSGDYLIDTAGNEIKGTRFKYLSHYGGVDDRYVEFSDVGDSYDEELPNHIGIYDTKERRVIAGPAFEKIEVYGDDKIVVTVNGVDEDGEFTTREWVLDSHGKCRYDWMRKRKFARVIPDDAGNFITGTYCQGGVRYGVTAPDGKTLIPEEYKYITYIGEGFYACEKDGGMTLYGD